ncbi:hypothetical protein Tco_0280464 [Tanacetum coccineum]
MLPYEGTDPLNPPPPGSDSKSEVEEAAPMPKPLEPDIPADYEPETEAATVGPRRLVPLTGRRFFINTQLSHWEFEMRRLLPQGMHYQEIHYDTVTDPTMRTR